jgi:hypothetical protein
MIGLFFIWQLIFFTVPSVREIMHLPLNRQTQDFEGDFTVTNFPNEFLTDWYGNEVRGSASRIYQANGQGKNGSKALAVQPISTFDGQITIRLSPSSLTDPKVRFWARSLRNGSGTRAAEVLSSWSKRLAGEYSEGELLGGTNEFGNEDHTYRLFELVIPEEFFEEAEVFLRLEVSCGPGSGSCAKWLMDDFEFGEFVLDKIAPKVINVRGFDEKQIQIVFDEALDPIFSEFVMNYKLDGVEPLEVMLEADSLVYLIFEEKLELGKKYELDIRQISDLEGNFLQDTLIAFQFFDPTFIPAKTLVINEIMPAPRADLDLPNVEYVEIFHSGDYAVRLEGVRYSNSRSSVSLDEFWVQPGEFVLLAPESQAILLMDYGKVIPIKSWPTLLNSGDQLAIKDDQGMLIDQLSYTTSIWGGSAFANGGYSLEVTNPFYACEQSDLLKPSIDLLRGTPGRQNSLFDLSPDEDLLILNSSEFTSSKSLLLNFSKPLLAGIEGSNFVFEPNLEIDSIFQKSSKQVQITFKEKVPVNFIFKLTITGLVDCSGIEYLQAEP